MLATETPPQHRPAAINPIRLAGWLRLQQTPAIGPLTAHALVAAFGTPDAIFGASLEQLQARARIEPDKARAVLRPFRADLRPQLAAIEAWLQLPGHHVLAYDDAAYPPLLREIADAPLLLYVQGQPELLLRPAVAIVGSRNASAQGVAHAARFGAALSEAGLTVISGLALGIDGAAHQGGLRGPGSTVAVIGTGADRVYPRAHRELAHQIAAQGCIVSDYALGTPARSGHFPRRNRIISGLARGVLVVEAAAKSGSLITARLAGDQGRAVCAIPGSINSPLTKGCHQLIRDGAKLVETAADVLAELGWPAPDLSPAAPDDRFVDVLLTALGHDPADADQLAQRVAQDAAQVLSQLLTLELAGLVERLPGGMFQRFVA